VPVTPAFLADPVNTKVTLVKNELPIKDELKAMFPTMLAGGSKGMQQIEIRADEAGSPLKSEAPLRIGCVLSGGQAAGGHNVIMGLFDMIRKLHPESQLFGFLAGPHGVFTNNYMEITPEYMMLYRNTGGFDMIRSGRHKIETPEQFASSLKNVTDLKLDGLVVIGGDDSNTNACLLAEYFAKHDAHCKVIGCPKTIDGDLKNEHIPVSFGFDTATKVYSEAIGNLCSDVISSKEYYHFIRLMGRSASHIALECALRTQINCVLIGEEVAEKNMTLSQITSQVADIIVKRAELGKNYGIVLVPEGLIEFIPEMGNLIQEINELVAKPDITGDLRQYVAKHLSFGSQALFNFLPHSISNQLLLDRDPHGNVQVSKIDTEKLLILLLKNELKVRREDKKYDGNFQPQPHFFGYEGRCALPSNFDSQYCYSLGLNAAVLIRQRLSGYMSCIKNVTDKNPANWTAAGTPLPTMMGIERRAGKDKPVISKALVELDGGMFKAYEAVRDLWSYLDCYVSPGPIQFSGAAFDELNFMVAPPNVEVLIAEAKRQEEIEFTISKKDRLFRDASLLGELSRARVQEKAEIPEMFERNTYHVAGTKKFFPITQLVDEKMKEEYRTLREEPSASYFVEIQDKLLTNMRFRQPDETLSKINTDLLNVDQESSQKIGVVFMGRQAPGGNNVIDGLLRFKAQRKNVSIVGFMGGVEGLLVSDAIELTAESFQNYNNLGGYDYIGRGKDALRTQQERATAAEVAKKLGLTGLVLIGATHTMTDGVALSQYFIENQVQTRVIVVPATVDGNIHHKYIQASIGFDTASKVYSQLIGNMLTDSASAIKYWYFVRLMGKEPSHLALECALKTQPNIVIISEECSDRLETLQDIVNNIADVISARADKNKNYGCVIIPEGLLSHVSAFHQLLSELNKLFENIEEEEEQDALQQKLSDDVAVQTLLTPWSYSLYATLPDFFKQALLLQREIGGEIKLSQIETEKLLAYFVGEELDARKKAGTYKGVFGPVTHFFGYQGRSGHPSHFDTQLGSTYGFAAGVLIEHGLTGLATSVSGVTGPANSWRVGGVPIMALLSSNPKSGYKKTNLVVRSEGVDLQGKPFQQLKALHRGWRQDDAFKNPGPIQYAHHESEDRKIADSYGLMYERTDNLAEEIRGLCHAI